MENKEITTDDFDKVYKYIYNKRRENSIMNDLFSELDKIGNVIIIGGVIRDLIIGDCEPRDIDLIVDNDTLKKADNILYKPTQLVAKVYHTVS